MTEAVSPDHQQQIDAVGTNLSGHLFVVPAMDGVIDVEILLHLPGHSVALGHTGITIDLHFIAMMPAQYRPQGIAHRVLFEIRPQITDFQASFRVQVAGFVRPGP